MRGRPGPWCGLVKGGAAFVWWCWPTSADAWCALLPVAALLMLARLSHPPDSTALLDAADGTYLFGSNYDYEAQAFRTGPNPGGYLLRSITLKMRAFDNFFTDRILQWSLWVSRAGSGAAIAAAFGRLVFRQPASPSFSQILQQAVQLAPPHPYLCIHRHFHRHFHAGV